MSTPLIVVGGGGHARVLMEALHRRLAKVTGFTDPQPMDSGDFLYPYLGDDMRLNDCRPEDIRLVNGLGGTQDNAPRRRLFERWRQRGHQFASA